MRAPGAGFVLLAVSLVATAAFFAWGLLTPRLERLWNLQVELSHGARGPLTDEEFALLEDAFARHPELATDWLDGEPEQLLGADPSGRVEGPHTWLLKAAGGAPTILRISSEAATDLQLQIRLGSERVSSTLPVGKVLRHEIAPRAEAAQLVEVKVMGPGAVRVATEAVVR